MVRRIIIDESPEGKLERDCIIDYAALSAKEIIDKIKKYEDNYGSFDSYAKKIDCGHSSIEEIDIRDDWDILLQERRKKILTGDIRISLNSKPLSKEDLEKILQENTYEAVHALEKRDLIKEYFPR